MPDLVTAAFVASILGNAAPVSGVGDGDKILAIYSALIPGASAAFVNMCNRKTIAAMQFTETRSGDGQSSLILRNTPIISVDALSVSGIVQAAFTPQARFGYAVSDNGFTVELIGGVFGLGQRNVSITYTAGYAVIPADIQQAVAEMVLWKKAKMPRIDQVSQSLNGIEGTAYDRNSLPQFAKDTIAQYMDLGGFRSR